MKGIRYSLIILLGIILSVAGCSEEKKEVEAPPAPPPIPVEFITATVDKLPIWVEFTGKTEASKRVEVRARVSGRLEEVLFKDGDVVEEGAVLFRLEREQYEATLDQQKAQLMQNRATLELAMKDVERYTPLVAEELAPRATLEQYQARVAELEAAIKANEAKISEAELNLSYTEVKAPISGKIGRSLVDAGNIVGYGEPTLLTTIVNDNPMYAYFNPTEREFQVMQQYKSADRMEARVRIRDKGDGLLKRSALKGQVDFADNRIDRQTGTITMRAEVANPDHSMLEGSFVYVEVMVTDKSSFLVLPPAAIMEDQRSSYVYIVGEGNAVERADIQRGYESRLYTLVNDGLEGGEKVVISGLAKLAQGRVVEPVDVNDSKGVRARLAEEGMLDITE